MVNLPRSTDNRQSSSAGVQPQHQEGMQRFSVSISDLYIHSCVCVYTHIHICKLTDWLFLFSLNIIKEELPAKLSSYAESVTYVKKIIVASLSNILYHRNVFQEVSGDPILAFKPYICVYCSTYHVLPILLCFFFQVFIKNSQLWWIACARLKFKIETKRSQIARRTALWRFSCHRKKICR